MTFELSSDLQALRARARAVAVNDVVSQAAAIDRDAAIPDTIATAAAGLIEGADRLALVVAVEEIAVASGAVALGAAVPAAAGAAPLDLAGLRGARTPSDSPRTQLVLAAVALGLGRAALDHSIGTLKHAQAHRGSHGDTPHWLVADVATELDGARLLIYKAAQSEGQDTEADIAMARLLASGAAQRTIDAALRIDGPSGYQPGSPLERLARDVRAVSLLLGTEEQQRAQAAAGLLPQ